MKRWIICMAALLLCACTAGEAPETIVPFPDTEIVQTEPTAQAVSPEPFGEPQPTAKEQATYAFSPDQVAPYPTDTDETAVLTTLWSTERTASGISMTLRNQTVAYRSLSVAVLSFDPASQTEALKLRVELPKDWSAALAKEMIESRLHFTFEIDGAHVDAFRDRVIGRVDAHTFELTYRRCLIHPLYGKTLAVRPYISCAVQMVIWDNGEKTVDFSHEGSLSVSEENLYSLRIERHYLDRSAVVIRTDMPEGERAPIPYTVTCKRIDWEESRRKGCYGEGNLPPETVELAYRSMDFSGAALALESLHVREDAVVMTFSWRFPDSFSDEECQSMWRDQLKFYAYFDGDSLTGQRDTRSAERAPFGRTRTLSTFSEPYEKPNDQNYRTCDCRTLHFTVIGSRQTLADWKTHHTLTIVPYCWYFTAVKRLEDGEQKTCMLSETWNRFENDYSVDSLTVDCIALDALAITVELTPELFKNGF